MPNWQLFSQISICFFLCYDIESFYFWFFDRIFIFMKEFQVKAILYGVICWICLYRQYNSDRSSINSAGFPSSCVSIVRADWPPGFIEMIWRWLLMQGFILSNMPFINIKEVFSRNDLNKFDLISSLGHNTEWFFSISISSVIIFDQPSLQPPLNVLT